jgi:hypothetical protein
LFYFPALKDGQPLPQFADETLMPIHGVPNLVGLHLTVMDENRESLMGLSCRKSTM